MQVSGAAHQHYGKSIVENWAMYYKQINLGPLQQSLSAPSKQSIRFLQHQTEYCSLQKRAEHLVTAKSGPYGAELKLRPSLLHWHSNPKQTLTIRSGCGSVSCTGC